jgi:ATP-binding cassette subfamily B protein
MLPIKVTTSEKPHSFAASVQALLDIWKHLSANRKRQTFLLGILMLVGGLSEAVSLGAILPFLAAIAAPETIATSPLFQKVAPYLQKIGLLKTGSAGELLPQIIPLFALFLMVAAIFSGAVRLLLVWQSGRLANLAGAEISVELYRRILDRPYIRFTQENSATVISNIAAKNGLVVISMTALLTLLVSGVIAASIFLTLFWIQPLMTILAGLLIGTFYAGFLTWSRGGIQAKSAEISAQQDAILLKLQEGLGGIRDIILDGAQDTYSGIFKKSIYPLRRAFAQVNFLSQSPRYVVESFALVLFVCLAWWAQGRGSGVAGLIPYLGALALGAQRLLPALQQGYAAWSTILGYEAVTQDALRILTEPLPAHAQERQVPRMSLRQEIRVEGVKFRYAEQGPWVLDGLSFTIPKSSRVGFVGKTGSGKSTCLDLLMGLLPPTEGRILIDGHSLDSGNLRSWQKNIAHVPQSIFLSDSNFAENIAFGIPEADIDMNRVREAARQAQIAEFIESSLEGYQTQVGERGIRLSGGQRQRIGIARALYKQAEVLVFDEATSALDGVTESKVMESIGNLSRHLTILMIAHRVTSLRYCDQILQIKNGKAEIVHGFTAELVTTP